MNWWNMITPHEEEMPGFLRRYIGKATGWRTPKRRWEDLWRLKRGELNHVMGMRKFGTITNKFKGPKFQKGIICATAAYTSVGTQPNLQDITDDKAPATGAQRIHIGYDSDGSIRWAEGGLVGSIVYVDLTTQTDDSNNHTNDWWPDQPDTNEGLNWDIRYTNVTATFSFNFSATVEDVWVNLDTMSNNIADATSTGIMGTAQVGKGTGVDDGVGDVEIRPTGGGATVASHTLDIQVTKT